MASASVSSVSGITAVLNPNGVKFEKLMVLKFRYEEELGQPFKIEIELECTNDQTGTLSPNNVVGRDLLVTISDGEPIRYFHAIMETFVAIDNHGAFNRYRGTAVPWYSLLKLTNDSRIHTYTPKDESLDIGTLLKNICDGFGFSNSHALIVPATTGDGTQRPQITRTQYCETYFQFLQRLLQQEGWYYYWTHGKSAHTMHTTDGAGTPPNFKNARGEEYVTIDYKPSTGGNAATECIYEWSHEAAVQPVNFRLSDYNYSTSATELVDELKSDYPSSYQDLSADYPFIALVIARHPGHFSKNGPKTSGYLVERLMQQFKCRQAFIRGKAASVGLAVGHMLRPSWPSAANPYSPSKEYLTTKITLQIVGAHDDSSHPKSRRTFAIDCEFVAIAYDAKNPYRPLYNVTEPRIFGVQSAVVCASTGGAKESEVQGASPEADDHSEKPIYCDYSKKVDSDTKSGPYGRVKVRFHWCRSDDERTDWIRLTHLMAGNGWGEFHLPRPGDEVLVAFEHGDPDRPVIVGCLYNDTHKMPFDLSSRNKDHVKLKKLFAIKDPGGNLFIMDPGEETSPEHPGVAKGQTISLYSPSTKHPSSVQIGQNDENWPGKPHH